jgi:hypothetical protein
MTEIQTETETEITFHNNIDIRVQAQIFIGSAYVCTCLADPGEVCILPAQSVPYDIFLKNGVTGWKIAHKQNIEATTLTLSRHKGRFILSKG